MGDIHGIPDDVLELILLRLPSPAHMIRAAAACRRWHGVVAGARFLRRFASRDGGRHLVAGSYRNGSRRFPSCPPERVRPAFVPAAARTTSPLPAARFSLNFLWRAPGSEEFVDPWFWRIRDSRGGLLLFAFEEREDCCPRWKMHTVVCEPLTRRYRVFPPMVRSARYHLHSGPFLLDGVGLSSFRVIMGWEGTRDFMGRTRASLFWHAGGGSVEALDRTTGEVSRSELPRAGGLDERAAALKVTAGGDGEARVLLAAAAGVVLKVFALPPSGGGGGGEWALEKTIELAAVARGLPGYHPSYFSAGEPAQWMIKVTDTGLVAVWRAGERWACRLDIDTAEAEVVPEEDGRDVAFPCELPWPPVLRHLAAGV
ncbi:hypothetical protein C2845_PM05G17210 [Panicum miliaceum]|uniref:F-box domain-containing protein n=1 Tax=Panicum miliaceum TaxID=4540 RepID=A0A3L6T5A0_PANMI|nr:hypothetical protein C2845_PM05G17210 [Panicum miliaceum]